MSILGFLSEVTEILRKLQSITKYESNSGMSKFLHDAIRYILRNQTMINATPLQIYVSGLVFAPAASEIKRLFSADLPDWISMPRTIENSWGAELGTLEGSDSVDDHCIAFSPNGLLLAAGANDGTIRLWNTVTGNLLQTLSSEWDFIRAIAFSPDSELLVSCSGSLADFESFNGKLQFWDTTTGTLQSTLDEDVGDVTSLVFTDGDRLLASPSKSWDFLTWDRVNGVQKHMLAERLTEDMTTVLSLDGLLLASHCFDKNIDLWNVLTGNLRQTLVGHEGIACATFSPNGHILASMDEDGIIILWDTTTGIQQQRIWGSARQAGNITFSPNGQLLASSHGNAGQPERDMDGTISLWDLNTYKSVRTLKGNQGAVYSTYFSPDGETLVSVSKSGKNKRFIKLWDTTNISPTQTPHPSYSRAMAFSLDGQLLASVCGPGTIVIWNVTDETVIRNLRDHCGTDQVDVLAFSPNSALLACSSDVGSIGVWDIVKDTKRHSFKGHNKTYCAAFSPDSLLMACSDSDNKIRLWDLTTRALQQVLDIPYSSFSLSFSPNGRLLALCTYDPHLWYPADHRKIEIWDHSTGHMLHASAWRLHEMYVDRELSRRECDFSALELWNPKTGDINERLKTVTPLDDSSSSESKNQRTHELQWMGDGDDELYTGSKLDIEIDAHVEWISYHGAKALCIPPNYDTYCWAMSNNTLALGHYSGNLTFIKFLQRDCALRLEQVDYNRGYINRYAFRNV
ncbi:quinon protein alcohol dehydrogenase-like superfamily [Trichoderma barbatum]